MSGFSISDLRAAIVRSLNGRCIQVDGGVVARNGDKHEHCGTCQTLCGGNHLGFSGDFEIERAYGEDLILLRWNCPICGSKTIQETTALTSPKDAKTVQADPLCGKCRKKQ